MVAPYGPLTGVGFPLGGESDLTPGPFPAGKGSASGDQSWLGPREDDPPGDWLRRPKARGNWGTVDHSTEKPTLMSLWSPRPDGGTWIPAKAGMTR